MDNINYIALGQRIKESRKRINMTQEALSETLDLSTVFISQIETGSRKPSLETINGISKALNVSIDDLLADSIEYKNNKNIDELLALLNCRTDEEISLVVSTTKQILKHIKDGQLI